MNINFAANLKRIREQHGLSKAELARKVGVSDVTIGQWENGKISPRMGKIEMIADILNVTTDELVFINEYTSVAEPQVEYNFKKISEKKVYGSISAGTPLEMINSIDSVEVPSFISQKYPKAFFLKVTGDSMNKIINDGMYALINPCEEAINGEVYAVAVNGYEATLKRFHKLNNSIVLEPDSYNEEHKSQLFNSDEVESVKIIGKLVWVMAPYNTKF